MAPPDAGYEDLGPEELLIAPLPVDMPVPTPQTESLNADLAAPETAVTASAASAEATMATADTLAEKSETSLESAAPTAESQTESLEAPEPRETFEPREPGRFAGKGAKRADDRRPAPRGKKPFQLWERPALELQTTTLWDYPSQHYGVGEQGSKHYKGATPSYVIWNLLQRYTQPNDTVVDPMCGSGTTLDVCRDTGRRGFGFDLAPFREDITQADAREIPLENASASFVFVDPPYSTHLEYSEDARCIGKLDAADGAYFEAMDKVFAEMARVLKPGGHAAIYVSDSFKKGKPFQAIGFELFLRMAKRLTPVDIVAVTRHNKSLKLGNWHQAAAEGNFFLRGFNYLFIFQKP